MVVRSLAPIPQGSPVTISYTDLLAPRRLRQADLMERYAFQCGCERCSDALAGSADSFLFAVENSAGASQQAMDLAVQALQEGVSRGADIFLNKVSCAIGGP